MFAVKMTENPAVAGSLAATSNALANSDEIGDTVLSRPGPALPPDLRAELSAIVRPPDPGLGHRVIPGLLGGFGDQGPTPTHWMGADRHRTSGYDIGLAVVAALLGDVFGWADQQDGRLVHNILPSPGYEERQVGASSTAALTWHTEDAFHPDRADFLLLACVRNPAGIGSRLSTINRAGLAQPDIEQLTRPHVVVLPDESYGAAAADGHEAVGMSTVWRRATGLGLRYDPAYSRILTDDGDFLRAYHNLGQALEDSSVTVPLEPGDVLIVDNDVTVHGRAPFRARYDGSDRWLKRVLVRAPRTRPARERLEHGFGQVLVHPRAGAAVPGN